jgi:hypothetical protein
MEFEKQVKAFSKKVKCYGLVLCFEVPNQIVIELMKEERDVFDVDRLCELYKAVPEEQENFLTVMEEFLVTYEHDSFWKTIVSKQKSLDHCGLSVTFRTYKYRKFYDTICEQLLPHKNEVIEMDEWLHISWLSQDAAHIVFAYGSDFQKWLFLETYDYLTCQALAEFVRDQRSMYWDCYDGLQNLSSDEEDNHCYRSLPEKSTSTFWRSTLSSSGKFPGLCFQLLQGKIQKLVSDDEEEFSLEPQHKQEIQMWKKSSIRQEKNMKKKRNKKLNKEISS